MLSPTQATKNELIMLTKFKKSIPLLGLLLVFTQSQAGVTSSQAKHITYVVPQNKSLLISLDTAVGKISKGNKKIADILLFRPNQLFLRGKSIGTTNAIIWNTRNQVAMVIDIEVTHNIESLKQKLYELLPNEAIEVRSAQRNVVLSGQVSNLVRMQAAMDVAQGFIRSSRGGSSGGGSNQRIINLMQVAGAHQVMLDVKIAEMTRTTRRNMNINTSLANTNDAKGTVTFDLMKIAAAATPLAGFGTLTGAYQVGDMLIGLQIEATKTNGLTKILAEPNLTTLSGQKASFLSGGEFPYSADCKNQNCDVKFKKFGIGLEFLPTVLNDKKISLNTHVQVSNLSNAANKITETNSETPSLQLREAETTVELADGQTMSIAGLISVNASVSQAKVPGLGDLPVIGNFFKESGNNKQLKELVIFVTPHLARPLPYGEHRLPTDGYEDMDDIDTYILGRTESRNAPKYITDKDAGMNGTFGHQINTGE